MRSDSYLLDTDVFVDHLRGRARLVVPSGPKRISVITRAELLAAKRVDEAAINRLLAAYDEAPVDRAVAEEAGRLRRDAGIALPDAIIVATALLTGSTLITRNRSHFDRIRGLRVVAPRKA